MAVAPKSAYGTAVAIGDGTTSETFNELLGARNINGPSYAAESIDVTSHSSAGNYREVVPSFLAGGEVTFDLLYDSTDTQHLQLFTDFEARTLRNFEQTLTDTGADIHSYAAYITGLELAAPIDDAVTMAVTLTVTGAITRS